MNTKCSLAIKCLLIAACLPLFAGCAKRHIVRHSYPPAEVIIAENAPPPPLPQTEVITVAPGPLDTWLWIPGGWEWRGRWIWVGGHWVARPHPGAVWVGPHFGFRGQTRVWFGGSWR